MNIINAIANFANNPITHLIEDSKGRNRANNAGKALEEYVKDLFAGTFEMCETDRLQKLSEVFSYLGNNSNPPDAMLRGGDAIEVKKIESEGSPLALNSSYPKHTLKVSSPMISAACMDAETWTEKDMIYVVGVIDRHTDNLKRLCMVYGSDYCASEETYNRIKEKIKEGVEMIPDIEFSDTKELGRVNRVDPLGITYLRVRGMWGIENPWNVFSYVYEKPENATFDFMCIINDDKWNQLENKDELISLTSINNKLQIKDIKIKNPDNPAKLCEAKLITFEMEQQK